MQVSPVPAALLFGNKTKPTETPSAKASPDPKPRFRMGRLLAGGLLATGSAGGLVGLTPALNAFHQWSGDTVYARNVQELLDEVGKTNPEMVARIEKEKETIMGAEERAELRELREQWYGPALEKLAIVGHSAPGYAFQSYLELILRIDLAGLMLASAATMRRTITPKELWAELHQKGLQGQGLRIGVLDSGAVPTGSLKADKLEVYALDGGAIDPVDSEGHGTAVAHIIQEALPESTIVAVAAGWDNLEAIKLRKEFRQEMLKEATDELNRLPGRKPQDMSALLNLLAMDMEKLASGLRTLVDKDVSLINVSLGVGYQKPVSLPDMAARTLTPLLLKAMKAEKLMGNEITREMLELYGGTKALKAIRSDNDKTTEESLQAIFKPWKEALDYAHEKGVWVVLAASNDGKYKNSAPDQLNHTNLLGLTDHPAILEVASARDRRNRPPILSRFSSEWNAQHSPPVADLGNQQVLTQTHSKRAGWKQLFYSPLGWLKQYMDYKNPPGTSFSAPMTTATLGMMRQVDPELKELSQAEQILKVTSQEIQPRRHTKKKKNQRHFVQSGLVQRRAAVAETERQAAQRLADEG